MKPSDVLLAVLVAVISGLGFTVVGGVAVMLPSKRPQALPEIA